MTKIVDTYFPFYIIFPRNMAIICEYFPSEINILLVINYSPTTIATIIVSHLSSEKRIERR